MRLPANLKLVPTICGAAHRIYWAARRSGDLRQLLNRADVRLVTLTGPGRHREDAARLTGGGRNRRAVSGGVYFVSLSAIGEIGAMASAIGQAVGVREIGNKSPQESLMECVGSLSQPALLLLDNLRASCVLAGFVFGNY